jgi:hypothetical protein
MLRGNRIWTFLQEYLVRMEQERVPEMFGQWEEAIAEHWGNRRYMWDRAC